MMRVIAITQFVFLALGAFTLRVIVKANGYPNPAIPPPSRLMLFLEKYGIWLLAIPVLWMAYASISESTQKGPFTAGVARAVGVLLAAGILLAYSYVILWQS